MDSIVKQGLNSVSRYSASRFYKKDKQRCEQRAGQKANKKSTRFTALSAGIRLRALRAKLFVEALYLIIGPGFNRA